MLQLTKRAIVETTLQMAQLRPINKITVRDIVEACGITRNTFYYHFHDIYEVLECAIDLAFDDVRRDWDSNTDRAISSLGSFFMGHRRMLLNLYKTIGRDSLADFFSKQIHAIIEEQIRHLSKGIALDERDLSMLVTFYEEAISGILLRWIRDDRKESSLEQWCESLERWHYLLSLQLASLVEGLRKGMPQELPQ